MFFFLKVYLFQNWEMSWLGSNSPYERWDGWTGIVYDLPPGATYYWLKLAKALGVKAIG